MQKAETYKPAKLKYWRERWFQIDAKITLHRIAKIKWDHKEDRISGKGIAVCGAEGFMSMPGIFSRMSAKRCKKCCELLELPNGIGCPYNNTDANLTEKQREA